MKINKRLKMAAALLLGAVSIASATAQTTVFDPAAARRTVIGPRTQVAVLATNHLGNEPGFSLESFSELMKRLAEFRPDVITIESRPGEQCDQIKRNPSLYPGVSGYCASIDNARAATGLEIPQALSQIQAMLGSWPERPSPVARRRLASAFMAAGEMPSALVQWLRLPVAERHAGDGLSASLAKKLDELVTEPNENYSIAATLAARLGLERVYAVDDHTSDSVISEEPAYNAALRQHWSIPNPALDPLKSMPTGTADERLAKYRALNRPDTLKSTIEHDFGASLRDPTPERWLRQYVAWWEVRNLRMVANIRASFARHPGARVLVIVGASHKPYFEDYLGRMTDVEVVDVQRILR